MSYTPKPGSFALFKNDKEGNEKRPDYVGDGLDQNGNPVKISAWIKQGKNGKFMSCTIQAKTRGEPSKRQEPTPDVNTDVPF